MKKNKVCSLRFEYVELRSGVWQLCAFASGWLGPIGLVTFAHVAVNIIQILDSYVTKLARRQGVRTALHKELLRGYPETEQIVTGRAANPKSAAWMKKMGYKKTSRGWSLRVDK